MSRTSPGFAYDRYCAVAQMRLAPARALHRRDRRAEARPAEQEAAHGAHALGDRHAPAKRVVARLRGRGRSGCPWSAPTRSRTARYRPSAWVDTPWTRGDGDAALVEAFRSGERSPIEELQASYAAIDASELNAFGYLAREEAEAAARSADVSLPFGGVPIGVKELDQVEGWPDTEACVVFADRIASHTSFMVDRLRRRGGAVTVGQTTASEFGGVNVTRTVLHGATHNPWQQGRTPGGSSGGSAAAVAGGLVTLATGGDGGGSIRIPAGFTGLVGLKSTYGRIPRGPRARERQLHRHDRPDGAQRARHGPLVRRVQRPRPTRPVQPAARRRVGARPRHARRFAARCTGGVRPGVGRCRRVAGDVGAARGGRRAPRRANSACAASNSTPRCRRWARPGASAG